MKTAAAYIRVSDERQDEFSPDSQLSLIKKYCADNDFSLPADYIFYDDGISARSSLHRAEFLKMIDLAKSQSHPIDAVIVWKYSRFARNQEESIVYKSMLKKCRVEVLSVSEPISSDPFGTLVERIIEWMDEYYLVRLSGEVKRGMCEKALRGLPNAPPPIGYKLQNGSLTPVESEAETVRRVFSLYLSGKSADEVAKELNRRGDRTRKGAYFDSRSVSYILNNPIYAGYTRWSRDGRQASERRFDSDRFIIAKGEHTPIISEKDFMTASLLLSSVGEREKKHGGRDYMLRGLLRCGKCGSAMVLCGNKSFRCANYSMCRSPTVSASRAGSAVKEAISQRLPTLSFKMPILENNSPTFAYSTLQNDSFSPTVPTKFEYEAVNISDFLRRSDISESTKNLVLSVIIKKIVFMGEEQMMEIHLRF